MGSGKSTWIKENNIEQYTLSADNIRLLFQSPVMKEDGTLTISAKNDGKVWQFLFNLLEERMKRGEFTIVDATHAKTEAINQYKKLAQKYRYRVAVVDFSNVPLELALQGNKMREEYKHVPENAIINSHTRMSTEKIPSWVDVIKPEEFNDYVEYKPLDLNSYNKVHVIGDIHGCYTVLMNYLKDGLNVDEMYIFCGDYLDRGLENAEVLDFLLSIYELPNVILLEGNHETHLRNYAHGEGVKSREFLENTQIQIEEKFYTTVKIETEEEIYASGGILKKLFSWKVPNKVVVEEEVLDKQALGEYKKEIRQLCRKFAQIAYFNYNGLNVVVTHGGLAKKPDNFTFMSTEEFIKGVGDYNLDIDYAWENNEAIKVDGEVMGVKSFQIHGHRNIFRLPTMEYYNSFNLEGQVENGGHLRAITFSNGRIDKHEVKNNVYKLNTIRKINEKETTVEELVQYMKEHELIRQKELGNGIVSFNFTSKAFKSRKWDDINVKARGLFINTENNTIASRSYNKFFNINEVQETKIGHLADNLAFPVYGYDKPNGYLGTVGYDSVTDELIFTSKSDMYSEHAIWMKELFDKKFNIEKRLLIKNFLKDENVSLVFEAIKHKEDPHIIKYDEDNLILLDIVKREIQYSKMNYEVVKNFAIMIGVDYKKLVHVFNDWMEFYKWYRDLTDDYTIQEEGYVIEDSNGFMTKIKLPYYNFWKQMRGIKDKVARKQEHEIKGASLYTPLHNEVFAWMKKQDKKWLKEHSIIDVRDAFYEHKTTVSAK